MICGVEFARVRVLDGNSIVNWLRSLLHLNLSGFALFKWGRARRQFGNAEYEKDEDGNEEDNDEGGGK